MNPLHSRCQPFPISHQAVRVGWGVWSWFLLGLIGQNLIAQETLPPLPNPYAALGIPPGPYSSGVGSSTSAAPDNPIPGFVNGEVNPFILGWAAEVANFSPANPATIDSYWKNVDIVLHPVTGNVFDVVSLGDLSAVDITKGVAPGSLTVKFAEPVGDGAGPDLVLFGNAFQLAKSTRVFAKLAYVEVSTDGVTFARFPSVDTNPRPSGAGWPYITSDATKIYNLFGKAVNAYGPSWGNPFDLHDLVLHPLVQAGAVDLQNILYVRLIAVPGSGSFQDSFGNPIYCPWPTYGSPGPQVQAVGFLNRGQLLKDDDPVKSASAKSVASKNAPVSASPIPPRSTQTSAVPQRGASQYSLGEIFGFSPLVEMNTVTAPTEIQPNEAPGLLIGEQDPADSNLPAKQVPGNLRRTGRTVIPTDSTRPTLSNSDGFERPLITAEFDDQSLRRSGVQSRINSYHPTLWGTTVQRVAYLTGWEPTPTSLAVIFVCGLTVLLLAVRYLRPAKRDEN